MAPRPRPKVVPLDAHRSAMHPDAARGPGDDAAAGETADMRVLKQAQRRVREVDALLQTAVGAVHDTRLALQRMRALALLAADVSLGDAARTGIQAQLGQLVREIARTATRTALDGQKLLDGSCAIGLSFPVGADASRAIAFHLPAMTPAALGLTGEGGVDVLSVGARAEAQRAVSAIEAAIDVVSARQAELGGVIEHLDAILVNLHVGAENVAAIMSRITDRDVAAAVTNLLKDQIVRQSAAALQAHGPASQGMLVRFPVQPPR